MLFEKCLIYSTQLSSTRNYYDVVTVVIQKHDMHDAHAYDVINKNILKVITILKSYLYHWANTYM